MHSESHGVTISINLAKTVSKTLGLNAGRSDSHDTLLNDAYIRGAVDFMHSQVRNQGCLAMNITNKGASYEYVPGQSMPNVRLASQCKERTIVINPETQETLVQRVVFDQRGFPIFDPYVRIETRISGDLANMSREAHMRAATRQLREDVLSGKIDRKMFTDSEWGDIKGGKARIGEYTWHHHQETGRMQLVPEDIHDWISHIGGNKLWGKE